MRLMGVQRQHRGTRWSWQVYVPMPSKLLVVGEFVPVPTDNSAAAGIQPPAPLSPLKPISADFTCLFPVMFQQGPPGNMNNSPNVGGDWITLSPTTMTALGQDNEFVRSDSVYFVAPPDTGYTLIGVTLKTSTGGNGSPTKFDADYNVLDASQARFQVHAKFLNFRGNGINLVLTLDWAPPTADPRLPESQRAYQTYQANLAAAQLQDYVNTTRALVKVTSKITPRLSDGLRYEERDAIYRKLYAWLSQIPIVEGTGDETLHVTAEYIRELFDVDEMLYYVEPDYYLSHTQPCIGPAPWYRYSR